MRAVFRRGAQAGGVRARVVMDLLTLTLSLCLIKDYVYVSEHRLLVTDSDTNAFDLFRTNDAHSLLTYRLPRCKRSSSRIRPGVCFFVTYPVDAGRNRTLFGGGGAHSLRSFSWPCSVFIYFCPSHMIVLISALYRQRFWHPVWKSISSV